MTDQSKPGAGGLRQGAGRKPNPNRKRMVSLKIAPQYIDWLRAHSKSGGVSQAVLVERALEQAYQVCGMDTAGSQRAKAGRLRRKTMEAADE